MTAGPLSTWTWRSVVFLIYLFLFSPLLVVVAVSFNGGVAVDFPPTDLTLNWYAEVFRNENFVAGFKVSILVALVTTALTILLGVPIAVAITGRRSRWAGVLGGLFLAPLLVPTIAVALGLLVFLSSVGLYGTMPALVIGHFGIAVPYMVRTTSMSLAAVRPEYIEAGRSLGASQLKVFLRVTLPLIRKGVFAGAIMSMIVSFDETIISLFIVGSDQTTLPVEMFRYIEFHSDPMIAALASLLIVGSVGAVVAIERLAGLQRVVS